MAGIPIKDIIYLSLIVTIIAALALWHHQAVLQGEAKVKAADASAVQRQQEAADAQKAKDQEEAKNAIQDLQGQLDSLRSAPHPSDNVVRLCSYAGRPSPLSSASPAPPGTQPTGSANEGRDSGVRSGGGGGDVGPGVRAIAEAGELLAIYREATVEWALKQSGGSTQ